MANMRDDVMNMIERTLRDHGPVMGAAMVKEELERHASVSRNNRHYCQDCFCCACLDVLREIKEAARRKQDEEI